MSNSVDPDETAHFEPSHLDLRCLQTACGSESVNSLPYLFYNMKKFTFYWCIKTQLEEWRTAWTIITKTSLYNLDPLQPQF